MIHDLIDALARPDSYRRFAAEKLSRTASLVAFLSLIFVGALGVEVRLRLVPIFDETFAWLQTQMPPLRFDRGAVTTTAPGPLRLQHPRFKEIALMIDTARKEPVTSQMLAEQKVAGYLTGNAIYLQRGESRTEVIDLTKSSAERPITIDADSYKALERAFDWVFYPVLLLFFFLGFAISLGFFGLVYALAGTLYASLSGSPLGFGAFFRLAIHAQTAAALLRATEMLLPKGIPYLGWISLAVSLAYLWLGARACVDSQEPSAPAA